MDIDQALPLLGNLSPAQFMRRHWQKKPLVVRGAIAGMKPLISRAALLSMVSRNDVESRLIRQLKHSAEKNQPAQSRWLLQSGPFSRRNLPPLNEGGWTLLLQGVDTHDAGVHQLLQQFRFVPDARLDDLMISFATPGGGVGPHFDSYDVFLLQASGRRRWKISAQKDLTLQSGVPLKILQNFKAEQEFVLEAGDMLYLPPRYAHDGVAEPLDADNSDDCMTYSIGFRAPAREELAAELLQRLAEFNDDPVPEGKESRGVAQSQRSPCLYKDPRQAATATPAALPESLVAFAQEAVLSALRDPLALSCTLGEYLTEPKPAVWFDEKDPSADSAELSNGVALDARTRMMYDAHHVFINGESHRARGADAALMRLLADQRGLSPRDLRRASADAQALLTDWAQAGWLRVGQPP